MARKSDTGSSSAIDGRTGRIVAAIILAIGIGVLAYLGRESFLPPPIEEEVALPELAACFERRLGAVETMRSENLLNDAQYEMFKSRAEAFCIYRHGDADSVPPASQ
ncbi:MAG: hypothetical protein JKY32_12190 [Rhizobiales bacterium]|nr:hypothetical protein [Hyphomicrobiales bacterium]